MRVIGRIFLLLFVAFAIFESVLPLAKAQDNTIALTVAVPDTMSDIFDDKFLGDFEAAHPGVKVQVVNRDVSIPTAPGNLDKYFDAYQKYANSADVLYVDGNSISSVATRAGYLLDLSPLVNEDQTLNVDDFFPDIWQSFQWDRGIWALPTASNIWVVSYDAAAFDKAGLSYPNDKWTIDDFDQAIRALAQKDDSGKVISPGAAVIPGYSDVPLLRSLIGANLFDANTVPSTPQIDSPVVEDILTKWVKLNQQGYITAGLTGAPLTISPVSLIVVQSTTSDHKMTAALLPGGKGVLDTQGFGVSAGTQHVQEAYALASYLTSRAELALRFAASPARKSLLNASGDSQATIRLNIPADMQALIEQGVQNGISVADMRFIEYVAVAYEQMLLTNQDAKSALQAAEEQAAREMQTAADQKTKNVLVVATPVPAASLPSGKVDLKFGLISFVTPLPNQDKWDQLIANFTSSDPQVGKIELDTGAQQMQKLTDNTDCFYLPFNNVPNSNLNLLLNLDPFLSADNTFDKADVLNGILPQLQRDNKTWALPIVIEPSILKYDSEKFGKSGVPAPVGIWTVDQFRDALKSLKLDPKDPPPFVGENTGGAHLLILIAAYGGLPLDYRTDPPTINFTDPATVDAMRQVLDLAKQGYIKYDALGGLGAGFMFGNAGQQTAPVYTDTLNFFNLRRGAAAASQNTTTNNAASPYKPVVYPKGTKFAAVSYTIGTAYISAKSQNPEACYRWLSTLAKHPDQFSAMPARRSQLDDPGIVASEGPDIAALYKDINTLLQDPNTISLPSLFSGSASPTGFLIQHWLFQAFDEYVLRDGDLDAALKKAETTSKGFQECAVNLPPLDASSMDAARQYIKAYGDCAVKVDPSLKPLFDLIK